MGMAGLKPKRHRGKDRRNGGYGWEKASLKRDADLQQHPDDDCDVTDYEGGDAEVDRAGVWVDGGQGLAGPDGGASPSGRGGLGFEQGSGRGRAGGKGARCGAGV